MTNLSGDPYVGAEAAHRILNPEATGQDWDDWVTMSAEGVHDDLDNFDAFACLCNKALTDRASMDRELIVSISHAAGFFEAMRNVFDSILEILPVSGRNHLHEPRYRKLLQNYGTDNSLAKANIEVECLM